MSDRIFLESMAFEGRHGVSDEERADPQLILVDLAVETDLRSAGESDDLTQTINYSELFKICRAQVETQSYRLLEAIAENIASDILERYPAAAAATVTVRKPGVPIDGVLESAGVTVERRRQH